MTEKKNRSTTEEPRIFLYDISNFLKDHLEEMTEIIISNFIFDTPFHFNTNIQCIFLINKDDENEIYTFDKNNKIKVIIPREKIAEKILNSKNYLKEVELHKYKVDLIKPGFDIKIGLDEHSNKFYSEFVLICEDFIKYERISNSFGSILRKNNYKTLKYISEASSNFSDNQSKFPLDNAYELLNVSEKLKIKNYFGFKDESDFYKSCDFLILSQMKLSNKKLDYKNTNNKHSYNKIIKSENFNLNDDNISTNGSNYDECIDISYEEMRIFNTIAKSFTYSTADKKKIPLNKANQNILEDIRSYCLLSSNSRKSNISSQINCSNKQSGKKTNKILENIEIVDKSSPCKEEDIDLIKIKHEEIDDIIKDIPVIQNLKSEIQIIDSKNVENNYENEEIIAEEPLYDLQIKEEVYSPRLSQDTVSINLFNNNINQEVLDFHNENKKEIDNIKITDCENFKIFKDMFKRKNLL